MAQNIGRSHNICTCNNSVISRDCKSTVHTLDLWEDKPNFSKDEEFNFLGFFDTPMMEVEQLDSDKCSSFLGTTVIETLPSHNNGIISVQNGHCCCNGIFISKRCTSNIHTLDVWCGDPEIMSDCEEDTNNSEEHSLDNLSIRYAQNSNIVSFNSGDVIWAKIQGHRWWPAILISGTECGQSSAQHDSSWVFWFGDYKVSQVLKKNMRDFMQAFAMGFSKGTKAFNSAVHEALKFLKCGSLNLSNLTIHSLKPAYLWSKVTADRLQVNFESQQDFDMLNWANNGFRCASSAVESPRTIPDFVREHLQGTRKRKAADTVDEDYIRDESILNELKEGKLQIEDICIACLSTKEVICQHPMFHGGLCENCKENALERILAYGDDGASLFCTICSEPGRLIICDNVDCNRCFCRDCIEHLVAPGVYLQVVETSPWYCYLCTSEGHGFLKSKHNWRDNIINFFCPKTNHPSEPALNSHGEKRAIRVLSLFDGIGTAKYVLDKLGIQTAVYYASEIDKDAINLTTIKHSGSIIHVGDVTDVSRDQLESIAPIDLLIGGSPCNDLSLVNPFRKGLYNHTSTGVLFFEFIRILNAMQKVNKGCHLFWLYENVAAMPREIKIDISHYFQCQPIMIDSKVFSAQHRPRYYWGNIPGMYSPVLTEYIESSLELDSCLTPGLNRTAVVKKIRTVTTQSNSLKQGKQGVLPVLMNGKPDRLWITELEEIFGFPRHYTDIGNISLGRRQKLLGKSWAVQNKEIPKCENKP